MSNADFISTNQLLSSLLVSTYQRLLPHLEDISLTLGQVVHEPGETITEVYFPESTIISLVLVMSNNSTTEVASVGSEGLVGLTSVLGGTSNTTRSIVQIPGTAIKISAGIIREEFQRGEEMQSLMLLYTQARCSHISQIIACKSHHKIEQQLARWLLLVHDGLQQKTLPLTHKLISMMLGVRRASITSTTISFQERGIIQYSRGKIVILDRAKLESTACECYGKIKSEYKRLLETKLI